MNDAKLIFAFGLVEQMDAMADLAINNSDSRPEDPIMVSLGHYFQGYRAACQQFSSVANFAKYEDGFLDKIYEAMACEVWEATRYATSRHWPELKREEQTKRKNSMKVAFSTLLNICLDPQTAEIPSLEELQDWG